MKVRLVSYTTVDEDFRQEAKEEAKLKWQSSTQEKDFVEPEFSSVLDLIAYCARVSNPSNQMNEETSERLIKYLIKHSHWSPLEMADATMEIDTTRDIAHQIVRHVSFRFQEFSQRYADPAELGEHFELSEARLQDFKNRQNSIELDLDDENSIRIAKRWVELQEDVIFTSKRAYEEAIAMGIAKEVARKVLPEGLTKTRLYMKGSIRSWIHYIELRGANGTQKEHMEVAHACAKAIAKIFPLAEQILN